MQAQGKVQEVRVSGRVIRADGRVEELGTLASWHANPLRRLAARVRGVGRAKITKGA